MFLNNFFTADEEKQWLQTTFLQITHHPASLVEKKLQEITLTPVLILKAFQEAYLSYDTKRLYFRNRTPENLTNQNCYYMLYDFVCENSGKKKQNSLRHLVIMHLLDMKEEKIQNDTEAMLCINKVQEFLNNFLKKEALEAYQPNKMVPQGVKEALLAVIKTHSFYSIHCPKDITEENYKQHVLSFLKSASSLKQKGIFLRHFFFFPGNLIQEVAVIKFLIPLFIEIMQQALSQKKLITQNNILALS
jgi:hypothetical protein